MKDSKAPGGLFPLRCTPSFLGYFCPSHIPRTVSSALATSRQPQLSEESVGTAFPETEKGKANMQTSSPGQGSVTSCVFLFLTLKPSAGTTNPWKEPETSEREISLTCITNAQVVMNETLTR